MKSEKNNLANVEGQVKRSFFNRKEDGNSFFQKKEGPSTAATDLVQDEAAQTSSTNAEGGEISTSINKKTGRGQPLPSGTKSKMAASFGADFNEVNIHTDAEAAGMSESMDAHAFTYGQDIYFNKGKYNPGTLEGDALLAHELAHTVQQKDGHQAGMQSDSILESDADRSTEAFILNHQSGKERAGEHKVMPKSKTGLKISRCSKRSSGAMGPARLSTAIANFRANNSGLTATELSKIETAMAIPTAGNVFLEISFFDYYSNHSITKDSSITGRELAFTNPGSDTRVNPSVLDPTYPNNRLGDLLLHEYVHTRHDTNFMGMGDYQEGDAYATEYFFAERTGDTVRMGEIQTLVSTSGGLTLPSLHASMQDLFRKTYATLKILYQVIDTGTSPHPSSPLVTPTPITRDVARALVAELISENAGSRSAQLNGIVTWAAANYVAIGIPPI